MSRRREAASGDSEAFLKRTVHGRFTRRTRFIVDPEIILRSSEEPPDIGTLVSELRGLPRDEISHKRSVKNNRS
jgi:hypothetical protein